ncbi:Shikimate kinase (SK) (fragment) [Bartonella clarridgeiae 73]|uniref:Shikimate kinase (SK) n=1 Tax=Bartonella clarridgeiae (strain CCUG 45776 / CIP 104772 / 73) TaxID=696125 RepID=E6YJJ1_BARC7
MQKLIEQRYPVYAKANLTINNHREHCHTVAQNVVRSKQRYLDQEIKDRNNRYAYQNSHR